jgi:hypothetical protein
MFTYETDIKRGYIRKARRTTIVDFTILQFQTDTYHPALVTGYLPLVSCTLYYDCSYRKYASGHYTIFSPILTGLICVTPAPSMSSSSTTMLLSEMIFSRKFPVVSSQSRNLRIDF